MVQKEEERASPPPIQICLLPQCCLSLGQQQQENLSEGAAVLLFCVSKGDTGLGPQQHACSPWRKGQEHLPLLLTRPRSHLEPDLGGGSEA